MFVVAPETVWNPAALATKSVPKRMLGRIAVLPRRGAGWRVWLRVIFEVQILRFTAALAPFVIAMALWPRFALPIAQAPLAMILVIGLVEMYVLRLPKDRRARQISEAAAEAGLDALRFRATALLTRIAARKRIPSGELTLVIEQSDMARVPPLTLVSVQRRDPVPEVMPLDPGDRALLAGLFDAELSERILHRINLREHAFLREVTLEARSISAHARMAALAAAPSTAVPA